MTKKHFDALATALADAYSETFRDSDHEVAQEYVKATILKVASVCARFNPNFDRARFLAACGVEESK